MKYVTLADFKYEHIINEILTQLTPNFHTWLCCKLFFTSSSSSFAKNLVILRLVEHVFRHVEQRWFILWRIFLPDSASTYCCKAFATVMKPWAWRLTTLPSSFFDQVSCRGFLQTLLNFGILTLFEFRLLVFRKWKGKKTFYFSRLFPPISRETHDLGKSPSRQTI